MTEHLPLQYYCILPNFATSYLRLVLLRVLGLWFQFLTQDLLLPYSSLTVSSQRNFSRQHLNSIIFHLKKEQEDGYQCTVCSADAVYQLTVCGISILRPFPHLPDTFQVHRLTGKEIIKNRALVKKNSVQIKLNENIQDFLYLFGYKNVNMVKNNINFPLVNILRFQFQVYYPPHPTVKQHLYSG